MVVNDPRLTAHAPPRELVGDRPCGGCGYNLRGLALGGVCPECGLSITITTPTADDPLCTMPPPLIRAFRAATLAASGIVIALIAIHFLRGPIDYEARCVLRLVLAILWAFAAIGLTPVITEPGGARRGFTRRDPLRRAARWSQWCWVLAAAAILIKVLSPNALPGIVEVVQLAFVAGSVGGSIAAALLAFFLIRLAEWTRDGWAEGAFNLSAWLLVPSGLGLLWSWWFGAGLVTIFASMGWLAGAVCFVLALLSVTRSVTHSVGHAREIQERERRRRERDAAYAEQVSAAVARMDGGD